jgi:hypothetical protein
MLQRLFGDCPECGAAIRPFTWTCPHCGADTRSRSTRLSVLGGVAVAVASIFIIVGGALLWGRLTEWRDTHLALIENAPSLFGPAKPTAHSNPTDFAWLERAMADCDSEAGKHLDALYFLVLPLAPTDGHVERWSLLSLGQIGDTVTLLPSRDALTGLKNGSLTLYKGEFVFSIIEPTTNITYNWKPATGVSEFVAHDAITIKSFKPGLRIVGIDPDTAWATTAAPPRAACYWVSALLRI